MKKFLKMCLVMLVAVLTLTLASCKDDNEGASGVVGTWNVTEYKVGDVDYIAMMGEGATISMEFTEDGKATMTVSAMGMSESMEGTYTVDGETITITIDGDPQSGTISGNTITISENVDGTVFSMKLTKA
ncbi:MAG: lipocalin family protein [Acholeplasmatales bacterium]|nr:lipocalin family protein [Acholeplasmatales bacterium]